MKKESGATMTAEECLICTKTGSREFLSQGDFSYLRCQRCGLVYLHPQPDFSRLRDLYAGNAQCTVDTGIDPTGEEIIHRSRFAGELDRIEKLRSPGRILDIGSAWGFFLAEARARGWKPGVWSFPAKHPGMPEADSAWMSLRESLRKPGFRKGILTR